MVRGAIVFSCRNRSLRLKPGTKQRSGGILYNSLRLSAHSVIRCIATYLVSRIIDSALVERWERASLGALFCYVLLLQNFFRKPLDKTHKLCYTISEEVYYDHPVFTTPKTPQKWLSGAFQTMPRLYVPSTSKRRQARVFQRRGRLYV